METKIRMIRRVAMASILATVAAACGSGDSDVVSGTSVPERASVGDTITVTSDGWEPDSEVTITLFSDPIELDTVTADDSGATSDEVSIPDVDPGDHELELSGTSADGEPRTQTFAIQIDSDDGGASTTSGDSATSTTDEDASTTTTESESESESTAAPASTTQPTATTRATTPTSQATTTQPTPTSAAGTTPKIHDESGAEPTTFVPRDCDAQEWMVIDPDGGPWSVAITGQPSYGTFYLTPAGFDPKLFYTGYGRDEAWYDDGRADSVTVEVSDSSGRSESYEITVPWTARTPPATGPGAPAPC